MKMVEACLLLFKKDVSDIKPPKITIDICDKFDYQVSLVKHLSMNMPIENALENAKPLIGKNQFDGFKRKFYTYQIEHAREIFEAQLNLNKLKNNGETNNAIPKTHQNFLNKSTLEHPNAITKKERKAKIAFHFLKNIQEVIFTTPWVVSKLSGVQLYWKLEPGEKEPRPINLVPPNMSVMIDIIQHAFKHNPEGTDDIWVRAFSEVAMVGKNAAKHKPIFWKRDDDVQAFYDQFLNFHINNRNFDNKRYSKK